MQLEILQNADEVTAQRIVAAPSPVGNPPPLATKRVFLASTPSVSDLFSAPGAASPHDNIILATSLEGGLYSPSPSADSNDPGLNSPGNKKGFTMSNTWMWILGIFAVLLALWYFNPGNILGKTST